MKRMLMIALLGCLLFTGCEKKPEVKLVSHISVELDSSGDCRIYRDPHKMQRILNGLRQLGQRYHPDVDPESLLTPSSTINVCFSDGSTTCYHLKSDRYIQTVPLQWQQTDAKQLQRLQFLLKVLPGDE
jgi:hypothetical protein